MKEHEEPGAEIVGNKVIVRDLSTTVALKKVTAKNERLIRTAYNQKCRLHHRRQSQKFCG